MKGLRFHHTDVRDILTPTYGPVVDLRASLFSRVRRIGPVPARCKVSLKIFGIAKEGERKKS
jgi:hypothetical protein